MNEDQGKFAGRWLHHGEWHGKEFAHEMPEYDHDERPGGVGSTAMRHAVVNQMGSNVSVWIPASWTEEQAREALENNW